MSSALLRNALVLGLLSAIGPFAIDTYLPSFHEIASQLNATAIEVQQTLSAYLLSFAAMTLWHGAISDRFGRRLALLAGNVMFAAASLLCAAAWDGPSLWLARGLQGIASAFVITGSLALIAGAYPEPGPRARAFGLAGIVSGIAMVVGPTLGGILAAWSGWRWIFLTNG